MTAPELLLLDFTHDQVLAPIDGLVAEDAVAPGTPQTLWRYAPTAESHPGLMVWIADIDSSTNVDAQDAGSTTSSVADVTLTVVVDAIGDDQEAARAAAIAKATEIRRAVIVLQSGDVLPHMDGTARHVRSWVSRSTTPTPQALAGGGGVAATTLDITFRTRLKAGQ